MESSCFLRLKFRDAAVSFFKRARIGEIDARLHSRDISVFRGVLRFPLAEVWEFIPVKLKSHPEITFRILEEGFGISVSICGQFVKVAHFRFRGDWWMKFPGFVDILGGPWTARDHAAEWDFHGSAAVGDRLPDIHVIEKFKFRGTRGEISHDILNEESSSEKRQS